MGVVVLHLQFADDTIIFCNNNKEEMENIKMILRCFQLMSDLKINYNKSSLSGVKISSQDVGELANIMGCPSGKFAYQILRLVVGSKFEEK